MAQDTGQLEAPVLPTLKQHEDDGQVENAGEYGWGLRHVQTAVMAVSTFMAFSLRINLSVAVVAMVQNANQTSTLAPTYEWGEDIQGYILSSFFWGYFILQIPAGIITSKFGGHRFLCFAIIGSSSLTVVLPQCAYAGGWFLLCVNRMMQGVCQGFVYPSIFTLLGVWSPPLERGTLTSITLGGSLLGTVCTTPISGYLCAVYGWPSVFYFFGGAGVVLGIVMSFLGSDSPATHKLISDKERHFIESSLGGAKLQMKVPWKNVLRNAPYWAALLAVSLQGFVYLMLLTKIPTYLATVLKFSVHDSGTITALPYLVAYLLTFVYSGSSDFLVTRGIMSLTNARKTFNSISHFGMALCIILMSHSTNRTLSVALLCATLGFKSATFPGATANFVDLSPNFSGPIFSVSNFTSACFGLAGPIIVGFIVTESGSAEQWRIVFYLSAVVLVASNVIYIVWGSAETQWWNWPDKGTDEIGFKEPDTELKEKQKAYIRRLSTLSM